MTHEIPPGQERKSNLTFSFCFFSNLSGKMLSATLEQKKEVVSGVVNVQHVDKESHQLSIHLVG